MYSIETREVLIHEHIDRSQVNPNRSISARYYGNTCDTSDSSQQSGVNG